MTEEFTITIVAEEPPITGANVSVEYDGARRNGTFSLAQVAAAVAALQRQLRQPEPVNAALEENGALLYGALFAGMVGNAYRDCLTLTQERKQTVRLRIYSDLPSIIAIPWEYLYDQANQRWLALHAGISLVRGLPLKSRAPQPVDGLLRVLVMVSDPSDLPRLNSAGEVATLDRALTTAAIELIRVEPTYDALQTALQQKKPHVFHFIGHGAFTTGRDGTVIEARHFTLAPRSDEAVARQGLLALCKADGSADFVGADRLVPLLASCESLGLVLLNACEGAVTGDQSAFAGLTQRLLQQQIPAVIAMQAPIVDDHAIRFSHTFYSALANGYGIEAAIGEGRRAIHGKAYTWGIPAFYLQVAEPFAMPQLTDRQKAERLWQKAISVKELAPRRQLLEATLALETNHVGAQAALARLNQEAEAARLYAAAEVYVKDAAWRAAYERLTEVERLVANFRNTRRLLAEVKGHLDGTGANDARGREQFDQYAAILDALQYGRLVPFLGGDISHYGRPAQDGWVPGLYPPGAEEAAQELALRLPDPRIVNPSLPEISQHTTILARQWALYDGLSDLYIADYAPTLFHRLLAELPGRLRAKGYPADPKRRLIIFSTAFDELLEKAFVAEEQLYHLFVYHPHSDDRLDVQPACFVHINPAGEAVPLIAPEHDPNSYQGHTIDQHPIIVKLCGHGIAQAPERLIITEDHYLNHLPQEIGALLPMTVLEELRRRNLLFFGYSLRPWYLRLLWQRLRIQKRPMLDGGWAIVPTLTDLEAAFWRDQKIEPIQAALEGVVAYLNEWLDQLEAR